MSIKEQLDAERSTALKAGDRATVNVIRQIESEVALVRTAEGFRGEVDDALYRETIETYVKRMDKARREYEGFGDRGRAQADKLAFEIEYLSRFLPQKLDEEATRRLVRSTIEAMAATDSKQRGAVIGAVMRSGEDLDGALVARLVAEELGG